MNNSFKLISLIIIMAIAALSFMACNGQLEGCGCCDKCTETCIGDCCSSCEYGSNNNNNNNNNNGTTINLTVTNNTGFQGTSLYVALSSSSSFGDDRLGATETLNNNQSKTIEITAGTYDIMLATVNSNVYLKENVNITSSVTVTITEADFNRNISESGYSHLFGTWILDNTVKIYLEEGYLTFVYTSPVPGGAGAIDEYEIISYEGTTMSVDYYGDTYTFKVVINSEGKLVISNSGELNFNGTYTNEDDYVYVFTPPDTATELVEDVWQRDYFSFYDDESPKWFTFDVTKGKTYKIYINDLDWNDDLTDVAMNIYYKGEIVSYEVDLIPSEGESYPIKADENGTVYVNVVPYSSNYWGSFDIGYTTTSEREDIVWQLQEDRWIAGNFEHSSELAYTFKVKAGVTYYIWIDDKNTADAKVDVVVSTYHYDGTTDGALVINGSENFIKKDLLNHFTYNDREGWITIYITPKNSSNTDGDNFEVIFSTNSQKPGKG